MSEYIKRHKGLVDYRINNFCRVCQKPRPKENKYCTQCGRRVRWSSKSSKAIDRHEEDLKRYE